MNFPDFGASEESALQPSTSHAVQLDAADTVTGPGGEQISKRTLQNRKAQREFRARRQAYLRDLEDKVRRYESGQADANTMLQRQVAQLQAENDQLRLQLAEMSRSQHTGPQPTVSSQHQAYRAPPLRQSQQAPQPQNQRSGLDQQPLYFPESELRTLPTSTSFEPTPSYSPVSQDSLTALSSPPHSLQQLPRQPSSRFNAPSHGHVERDAQQISADEANARLSSFDLRTSRGPYSRPGQPPVSGGSGRVQYMDASDPSRVALTQSQSQPAAPPQQPQQQRQQAATHSLPWGQLSSTWYNTSNENPPTSSSQAFMSSEYERFGRR